MTSDKTSCYSSIFPFALFLFFFLLSLTLIHNYDLFWHLKTGQWMIENRKIPVADFYSFTRMGTPWINHSWLSQILFYGIYQLGGYSALIFSKAILTGFLMLLLNQILGSKIRNNSYRILLLTFLFLLIKDRLMVRPEIFTAVLFGLVISILYYSLSNHPKVLYFLPLLFILWFNLHAAALAGLFYLGAWIGGQWIESILKKGWRETLPLIKKYSFIGIVCLLSTGITPRGFMTLFYGLSSRSSGIKMIIEWQPPDFSSSFGI